MSSNINVKPITIKKENFFIYWLQFLKPYHKLRNKEIELLALFLVKRFELSKVIKDDVLIDKLLFDKDVKLEIRNKMGYSTGQVLENMLSGLRAKNIIVDNKIDKGLIPNLEENNTSFKLVFNFIFKDDIR